MSAHYNLLKSADRNCNSVFQKSSLLSSSLLSSSGTVSSGALHCVTSTRREVYAFK